MSGKIELLLPAGDPEKFKVGLAYGGDAFYAGGEHFSLRNACRNFTPKELESSIRLAHESGRKFYLALNIFPRCGDFPALKKYLRKISKLPLDALIVSDLGIIELLAELKIGIPLHISTQANILNHYAVAFLNRIPVKRIILARELSRAEISLIRKKHRNVELEIFVHGAMCVSYSGRCLLSLYFNKRDANKGDCSHPCRWKYQLQEEKRPGVYLPISEEDSGSLIFNSRDLCLIGHLPEIISLGIDSVKIEGRVKSEYYLAVVGRTYREAIDSCYSGKKFTLRKEWLHELASVSHREYTTGFFTGLPADVMRKQSAYLRNCQVVGKILSCNAGRSKIHVKNNLYSGDSVEVFSPEGVFPESIRELRSGNHKISKATNEMIVNCALSREYSWGSFLRKREK
ncbi:MAG: U32 family peptidase C-terminal domain-containing protein [Candidatus Wallbacteria bacterium]|nr:U32 family peptidase C-terminal domain-containing protein [Candidatus Wallbacteria bacterium]